MPKQVTTIPFDINKINVVCELDEQWSYVQNKKNQRWLWYAFDKYNKRIVAHCFGDRSNQTLHELLKLLKPFKIKYFCTDDYKSYSSLLPRNQHIVGKKYTQNIERYNLNLRNRLKRLTRKTSCFSKSEQMHDKVIGTFIEREFYC